MLKCPQKKQGGEAMTVRTSAERQELVEECRQSGRPKRLWCQEKGIPYTTFANWAKKVTRESSTDTRPAQSVEWAAVMAPVKEATAPVTLPVMEPASLSTPVTLSVTPQVNPKVATVPSSVTIHVRGSYEIKVETGFDPELLAGVLQVVNRVCC